jgi:flavin-dependent dehydrogenase
MYDVIVVGARCAGSPLAMLLAKQGAKVLLVDRATLPSDIPHGNFIHRDGPRRLKKWGLLDNVAEVSVPITSQISYFGDFPMPADDLCVDGMAWGYAPRRDLLDYILVQAAVRAGAEVREGFSVESFVIEDGRVAGIRGHGRDGKAVEEQAALTVGADGRNSRLARAVDAPVYDATPPMLCYYFSYWSGVDTGPCLELHARPRDRRLIISFPSSNGLYGVFVGWPAGELAQVRGNIESNFMTALDLVPELAERVRAGHREERFYGASDLPNFFRKPYGPGWALAGDAGCHKDPFMALGICDAFRDVELLAGAIAEGATTERPMEECLAGYERNRNEASGMNYQMNASAARFDPYPEEILLLRRAIRDKPDERRNFALARGGMVDPTTFFNPENMRRLIGPEVGSPT